jgi:hypothetical protein
MWIFDELIFVLGYAAARLVLPLLSLNKIYVQPLNSSETRFNVLGYRYDDDSGRIEISSTIAGGTGFAFCLVAFFAVCLVVRAAV